MWCQLMVGRTIKTKTIRLRVRTVLVHSTEALQHLVTVVDDYDRLKCCSVKAAKDNKLVDYLIASRRTMIDDERIGPHGGVRLIMYEDR